MKSLIYTLATILSLVFISMEANAQAIVGYSDLFTFDTRLTHVQGTITEEGSGNPISGVIVTLSHPATSLADGSYSLDSVPTGNYVLSVFDPSCQYELYEQNVSITGESTQTINASLTPGDCGALLLIDWFTDDTLYAFADNINENPTGVYALSGNVNMNNVLYFDGDIEIDDRPSLDYPEISGSCGFYAKDIPGYSVYWIKNNNVPFLYYAEANSLKPQGWANMLPGEFLFGGFNITIGEIILDSEFDKVEVKSIANMPFPINKVIQHMQNQSQGPGPFVQQMSCSAILSKTDGEDFGASISGVGADLGFVKIKNLNFNFDGSANVWEAGLTLTFKRPGPDKKGLLTVGGQIGIAQGAFNDISVSVGTKVALGTTGLFITEISGGLRDLATEDWKIGASVDIELGFKVPVLGSPIKLDNFGVWIDPMESFWGEGRFLVFNNEVSNGYIEFLPPERSLYAECWLELGGVLRGRTYFSLVGGQASGSGTLTLNTPARNKLPGWLKWAGNQTIGSAQSEFNNQYFSSNFQLEKNLPWPLPDITIGFASRLEFGDDEFPYLHFYLGTNLNNLFQVFKGERDGINIVTFKVPKNARQLLVVAMDTVNPTLFDFSLEDPDHQIVDKDNAYYYDYYEDDSVKQTIMSVLKPMEGEWDYIMPYDGQVDVHFAITNQEPTFIASEPSQRRSRSNDISLDFTDYDDTLNVQVFYNTNNRHFNGRMIDEFRIINNGKLDFTWHNQDVANGEYFIYCRVDDGYNAPYLQYAPGSIWVENDPAIESPQNFTVVQENNAFLINWDEPVSSSIKATTVYYKNISTGRIRNASVFESYSLTLADLKPGQEYQLWACFMNSNGTYSEPGEKINRIFTSNERNNPPYFTLDPYNNFIFVEGEQSQYQITANDADGDLLTFDLPGDTLGITLNDDQLIWTPAEGDRGVSDLLIVVTDGLTTDTIYQQLIVYTPEQVSVDLEFSSENLFEKDNMFVRISNFFCPDFYQPVTLRNIRTQEEVTIETRRVNDFEYYGQFGLSFIDRSDISVANGDTIEAKYMYLGDDYYSYSYYDSLPQPSDNVPPGTIDDLSIEQLMNNEINLKWTATGNDAGSGKAYSYDIRYAYEPINSEDVYFTAYRILEFPYPSLAGEKDSLIINLEDLQGINQHENVYFSIKAEDEMQNFGGLSNSPGTHCSMNPTNVTAVLEDVYYIVLNWDGPLPGKQRAGLQHYNVFRKIDEGDLSLLQSGVVTTDFVDNLKTDPDGTYQYAIQAIYDTESSDTVYTPAVLMDRFVNVSLLLSLQDTSNYQGIVFDMNGLDDVYSQEFSGTTNSTGLEVFDNVFYGQYEITASKENYHTLLDTINVS